MPISNPVAGATLTVAQTEVFNGTAPIAFTDLDLSAVIGAKASLVLLKVYGSGVLPTYAFRRNGDGDNVDCADQMGCAHSTVNNLRFGRAIVETDAAGIVEWRCSAANTGVTIDIVAYVN